MDVRTLRRALAGIGDDAEVEVRVSVALPGGRTVTARGCIAGVEVVENPALAARWVTLLSSSDLSGDACAMLDLGMISEEEWEEAMPG